MLCTIHGCVQSHFTWFCCNISYFCDLCAERPESLMRKSQIHGMRLRLGSATSDRVSLVQFESLMRKSEIHNARLQCWVQPPCRACSLVQLESLMRKSERLSSATLPLTRRRLPLPATAQRCATGNQSICNSAKLKIGRRWIYSKLNWRLVNNVEFILS